MTDDPILMQFTVECPCCGGAAATAGLDGLFTDGQELECGCVGHVSCDGEDPPYAAVWDCTCDGLGDVP